MRTAGGAGRLSNDKAEERATALHVKAPYAFTGWVGGAHSPAMLVRLPSDAGSVPDSWLKDRPLRAVGMRTLDGIDRGPSIGLIEARRELVPH